MIYRPVFRLVLSVLESKWPKDKARAYAVVVDPSSGQSGVYLDGVPWPSEFFAGDTGDAPAPPTYLPGTLGLVSLRTQETMQNHGASLSLLVGEVGASLRKRILPHDLLRVEIFDASTRTWRCAFDGHLVNIQWSKQSDPGSYHWRMDISAQGLQKIFSEQWLDWQSMVRATDTKGFNPASKGFSFFKELADVKGDLPISELVKKFIIGAVDQFLEFGVRGQRAGNGRTFQVASNLADPKVAARDWQTAWNVFIFPTQSWYLQARGAIWGLLAGLSEPDVHEFFISYDRDGSATEFREIPTIVFRPRPWPGPPARAVTAKVNGDPVDDDSLWRDLDVLITGLPGSLPAAFSVGTSRNDSVRSNHFFISLAGAADTSPNDLSFTRTALGFRVDEGLVKRYGFSSRQVSLGNYLQRMDNYYFFILPSLLDRVAWQEAPLPFLLDQTRSFPLIPGVHVGSVLQDHSESQDAPTTGYIISVAHSISGNGKSLRAETVIGTTRAIEGVTAEGYPAAVRKLVDLKNVSFVSASEVDKANKTYAAAEHSQPAAVNPPGTGKYDLFISSSHPELQDKNPPNNIKVNLSHLEKFGIKWVDDLVGPIVLTSVYRSPSLNARVSTNRNSDHMKGLAFDFQMASGGDTALYQAFLKIRDSKNVLLFKDCIIETRASDGVKWIHYAVYPPGGAGEQHMNDGAKTGD